MRYFFVSMNCINFRPPTSLIDLIYASIQTHANSIGVSSREPSNPQWSEDHYSVTDQAKTWLNGAFVIAIWFVSQGLGQVVSLDYAANRLLQFFVLMPELFTSSRVLKSLWLTSNKFHENAGSLLRTAAGLMVQWLGFECESLLQSLLTSCHWRHNNARSAQAKYPTEHLWAF